MRFLLLLGLGVLACGDPFEAADSGPIIIAGHAGAVSVAGATGQARGGGHAGGASGDPAGSAGSELGPSGGVATAGTSDGGSSSAAAGDAGTGGTGGTPPAPDDAGCVAPPLSAGARLPGFDCSSCSTGETLGYTVPGFCSGAKVCMGGAVNLADFPDDFYLLLPPEREQADECNAQACEGADGEPTSLNGFTLQLTLVPVAGKAVKITTDAGRRVLTRDNPLVTCTKAASCLSALGSASVAIVVKPGAPRGWARITVNGGLCQ